MEIIVATKIYNDTASALFEILLDALGVEWWSNDTMNGRGFIGKSYNYNTAELTETQRKHINRFFDELEKRGF